MYTFSLSCSKRKRITESTARSDFNNHNNSSMQTQSWFKGCIRMSVRALLLLPERKDLLKDPAVYYHPIMQEFL